MTDFNFKKGLKGKDSRIRLILRRYLEHTINKIFNKIKLISICIDKMAIFGC